LLKFLPDGGIMQSFIRARGKLYYPWKARVAAAHIAADAPAHLTRATCAAWRSQALAKRSLSKAAGAASHALSLPC